MGRGHPASINPGRNEGARSFILGQQSLEMNDRHKWHIGQGDQGRFYTALVGCRYAQGYRARNPLLGSIVYQSLTMAPLQRRVACSTEQPGQRYGDRPSAAWGQRVLVRSELGGP